MNYMELVTSCLGQFISILSLSISLELERGSPIYIYSTSGSHPESTVRKDKSLQVAL